jgi:hypothetical protein
MKKPGTKKAEMGCQRRTCPARGLGAAILIALAGGCESDHAAASAPVDSALRFIVTNQLLAPVVIAIDDTVNLYLINGQSGGVAASRKAQWLTWTSSKPTDFDGTPIPDDIGKVTVRVSGIGFALEINNVIQDTTYITGEFLNHTNVRVTIGVYDGSVVSCASVLPAASSTVVGFTKIGYYRLLPATEIRAYRDGSRCTGPYVSWPTSQLTHFNPKSGLVSLALTSAP